MKPGELAAFVVGDVEIAIEPGVAVVEVNARRLLLFLQELRGGGGAGEGNVREIGVSHRVCGAV
jgi:hypothetical protein